MAAIGTETRSASSTPSSSAPDSVASTCCTSCATSWASTPWPSTRPAGWAAPGTGTSTRARCRTPRASSTSTRSTATSTRRRRGRRSSCASPRSSSTSTASSTATTCASTSRWRPRMTDARFDEVAGIWTVHTDRGVTFECRFLVNGLGPAVGDQPARLARHGRLRGPPGAHRRVARGPGSDRQAGRRDRQRLDRQPGDHRHRPDRRAPDLVPAHPAVQRAGRKPRTDARASCRRTATTSTPTGIRSATPASPWASRRARSRRSACRAEERERIFQARLEQGRRVPVHVRDVLRHRHRRGRQRGSGEASSAARSPRSSRIRRPRRKLTPTDLYARRPLCDSGYYETFNRPNVSLVEREGNPDHPR